MTFNNYPELEKKYGNIAFEISRRDIALADKIVDNYNKMIKKLNKHKR